MSVLKDNLKSVCMIQKFGKKNNHNTIKVLMSMGKQECTVKFVYAVNIMITVTTHILLEVGEVWHGGMGVTTQPQNPGFEPQFRHKCWANPAVPAAISKVAAVVCCCSNGWS